ncbi:DUF3341 domain-containing protein [Bordetella petrii]|nr:DUF3341 domain-containing protein [Bordetella petrii]
MKPALYGILAEFDDVPAYVRAVRAARDAGYPRIEAYSPFPVEEVAELLGGPGRGVARATLAGGLGGGVLGYLLQWYSATQDYPINVGGRPLHSWPMFIPVAFELAVLFAALAAVAAMLAGNRLPALRHPMFNDAGFARASRDRFFVCLGELRTPRAAAQARAFLAGLAPLRIAEVAR